MIKVCHISSLHKWDDTRIFYKECVTLANAGFDVSLVAPSAPNQRVHNVQVYGVAVPTPNRFYRITIIAWKVFRTALKTNSKIYHFHDPELIWVGFILKALRKTVVYDVHENVGKQIKDKKWLVVPQFFAFIYAIFDYFAARIFHLVLAEDSYEEIYANKAASITKVLNYPDLSSFEQLRKNTLTQENGILYVGLVSKLRGVFEILAALKKLDDQKVDFHFHCVGPMFDDLQKEIKENKNYLQVQEKITFYGPLPVYEAYQLANQCKVGLSILHPVPNYLRSFSTKIFEYMALGLPFIVSDFEIYKFVKKQEVGFCIDPLNPEELATTLKAVLLDEVDRKALIQRGIDTSVQFSWEQQAQNLIQLYTKISR
jgi:glycosyltransferase involved in cell wall biosynthesis